ncbi:hypothetical protein [Uliginosibacterium sp. 31-12]|uniref:phage adaptor protein n=1 Tax=Uliginosibacterium sp. 31-12 TaxID=3062781 RepID=UPI0026E2C1D0|nr:hypothetical protein [Uliginosibacterium sp. 31-12]MDO6385581.1 hypothetical protein [Uliginosibacterium sp. 31-12]
MAIWSSWLNDVMPEVPGALLPVVEHAIRRAAQEFFARSKVWKTDRTITPQAGVPEYSLSPSIDMTPVQIMSAGRLDIYMTDEDMQRCFGTDWRTQTGDPKDLLQLSPASVRLFPIPSEDGAPITVSVAVIPSDSATGIPDEYAVRYRDGIAAGALARLMKSAKKPYTDEAKAAMYQGQFEAAIGQAISDRASGFGRARSRRPVGWH